MSEQPKSWAVEVKIDGEWCAMLHRFADAGDAEAHADYLRTTWKRAPELRVTPCGSAPSIPKGGKPQ